MIDSAAHEESALRYIKNFQYKYGQEILHLAFHAALPVVINADFVHLLRINFFFGSSESLPFTSEADLLLSSLCYDIGDGLYEIAPNVRNVLLQKLVKEYSQERVREVATLLWQYNEHYTPWGDRAELERAQQLTALNFLDSLRAKQWLAEAEASSGASSSVEREWFVAMWQEIEQLEDTLNEKPDQNQYINLFKEADEANKRIILSILAANSEGVEIRNLKHQARQQGVPEINFDEVLVELRDVDRFVDEDISLSINKKYITRAGRDYLLKLDGTFGKLLRQFRRRLGFSQAEIAEELGVSAVTISRWENDVSRPSGRAMVARLAKVLRLSNEETEMMLRISFPSAEESLEKQTLHQQLVAVQSKTSTDQPGKVRWPGSDEDVVIDAMLADSDSPHWRRCYDLVEKLVQQRTIDLSADEKDEIIQDVMTRIALNLPNFKRQSQLTTWITTIVNNSAIDTRRLSQTRSRKVSNFVDASDDTEDQESEDEYAASEQGMTPVFKIDGSEDPAFEFEFKEIDPQLLSELAQSILTLPPSQRQAMFYALKDGGDDALPILNMLSAYGVDIESLDWPQEKDKVIRLRASLSIARKKLRSLFAKLRENE